MSKKEKTAGRPTKKDPEVVTKLTSAFSRGFSITEACAYSGIARETFYRWLHDDLDFCDKMQQARARLNIRAKEVLAESVEKGDVSSAKWWLDKYSNSKGTTDSLSFRTKVIKDLVKTTERLIALRYRKAIFSEREELLKKKDYKLRKHIERLDKLIALSDSELSEYAELEVYSLGIDKAGVRDKLLDRRDYLADVTDELKIIERSEY